MSVPSRWIDSRACRTDCSARTAALALCAILAAALLWRWLILVQMPCISRDGVLYCWQARDLGHYGVRLLAMQTYDQHPLYAAAILFAQRAMLTGGGADTALTWQYAAQAVSMVCGLQVVWLCYLLTLLLVRYGGLEVPARKSGLFAAALAALLPLNVWLSVDAMSESLFFTFYLAAICFAVRGAGVAGAAGIGVLSGAAYLVRPEGVVPLLAGILALVRERVSLAYRFRCVASALTVFLVVAGPYVVLSGGLSPKLRKEPLSQVAAAPEDVRRVAAVSHAALVREPVSWFAVLPRVVLEVGRAGRVVVPLLALLALWRLGRARSAALASPLLLAAAGQCALGALLVWRHGYLDPRHMLSVVLMLIPFAALAPFLILSTRASAVGTARGGTASRLTRAVITASALAVSGVYALRVPNAQDAHLRQAATWLAAHPAVQPGALMLGGSSERRIAFYAGLRFQPWPENLSDPDARSRALLEHLVYFQPRVFALETAESAAQRELRGNARLPESISADIRLREWLLEAHTIEGSGGRTLRLFIFDF